MTELTLATALRLAEAVREAAEADGAAIGVAIVDGGGNTMLLQRMDSAYLSALTIAERKAFTALNFSRTTKEMADRLADPAYHALLSHADNRLTFLQGGVPLFAGDVTVGAIGVSGGSAQQDEDYCRAAIGAVPPGE